MVSKPKDLVPDLQRSGVVYKIHCANCPKVYIGQTKRRLSQRLTEHKRAVKVADFNSSALAEHAWCASHPVDWENTRVLSNCSDYHSRLVQEAIFIRSTSHTLNRDNGTLPAIYDDLVYRCQLLYHLRVFYTQVILCCLCHVLFHVFTSIVYTFLFLFPVSTFHLSSPISPLLLCLHSVFSLMMVAERMSFFSTSDLVILLHLSCICKCPLIKFRVCQQE